MILVVDDNHERRKNTVTWLRVKGYMATGIKYDDLSFYTKPFMTVYINPLASFVSSLADTDDTVSVIITDRPSVKVMPWAKRIDTLNTPHISIMKIFDECFDHFKTDQIEIVGYACLKNDEFALGGELISLSNLEYLIVCFFMINKNKKFKLYDCSSYFNFKSNPEENFKKAVSRINTKCKHEYRPPLLFANDIEAYFNPEIANWVSEPYREVVRESNDMSDYIVIKLDESFFYNEW